MKLQNLIIIFIIIIIPIVLIFSLYLKLEIQTITTQTSYDEKFIEATKEAMEAFEINTVEWNNKYSSLANSKRRDIMASINTFTTSLGNKLGISGTSKENILTYVPAMVYMMYDGYYIYTPTHIPKTITDDNGIQLFYYSNATGNNKITSSATQNIGGEIFSGQPIYYLDSSISGASATGTYNGSAFTTNINSAKKEYKHVLKTFVPYSTKVDDYVINYTLDNYIRLYSDDEIKEGYVIEDFGASNKINLQTKKLTGIKYNGISITPEILTENIATRNNVNEEIKVKEYAYIYNSDNEKRYYDNTNNRFFTINNNSVKVYLPVGDVGTSLAEYKKVVVKISDHEYIELYQVLNNNSITWYYKGTNNEFIPYTQNIAGLNSIAKFQDCSALNYYVEAYKFNRWLVSSGLDIDDIIESKRNAIIENINDNLNLSIANYSANSKIDYKLPEISDNEWDQALSNISIIAFFQGVDIGLKTYNNYVVVSSTENNEYVGEDSLYYINNVDEYYHRYGCSSLVSNIAEAYKKIDFKVQSFNVDDENVKYYYKHSNGNIATSECFDCIVNRNNMNNNYNRYKQKHYIALARERYVQMKKIRITIYK